MLNKSGPRFEGKGRPLAATWQNAHRLITCTVECALPAASHPCATTAHHNGQALMRELPLSAQHRRASEAAAAKRADDAATPEDAVGGCVYGTHLKNSKRWARPPCIHSSNRVLRVRGEKEEKEKPQPSLGRSAREVKGAFTLLALAAFSSLFLSTSRRESWTSFLFCSFFELNFFSDCEGSECDLL